MKTEFSQNAIPLNVLIRDPDSRWWIQVKRMVRQWPRIDIISIPSLAELQTRLSETSWSISAIEIGQSDLLEACRFAVRQTVQPVKHRLIALGDPTLSPWRPYLSENGFAATLLTVVDSAKIARLINRHANQVPRRKLTVEQSIWRSLPWRTASQHP